MKISRAEKFVVVITLLFSLFVIGLSIGYSKKTDDFTISGADMHLEEHADYPENEPEAPEATETPEGAEATGMTPKMAKMADVTAKTAEAAGMTVKMAEAARKMANPMQMRYDWDTFVLMQEHPRKKLNINRAEKEDFMKLDGVDEALAEEMIEYREQYGEYGSIIDLLLVPGMSDDIYSNIDSFITTITDTNYSF